MEYTLAGAAEATGVAKTTIFRAIKSGKLSARRLDDKTFRIDASELARVYPPKPPQQAERTTRNDPQHSAMVQDEPATPGTVQDSGGEAALLRLELRLVREQLEREREDRERERETTRETVEDLRRRLDGEQEERRNLQRLLAAPERVQEQSAVTAQTIEPARASRGFLERLLGR